MIEKLMCLPILKVDIITLEKKVKESKLSTFAMAVRCAFGSGKKVPQNLGIV